MNLRRAQQEGYWLQGQLPGLTESQMAEYDLPEQLSSYSDNGRPWNPANMIGVIAQQSGYLFIGVDMGISGLYIGAGCRWYTLEDARAHWYQGEKSRIVEYIAQWYEARNQKAVTAAPAPTGTVQMQKQTVLGEVYAHDDLREYLGETLMVSVQRFLKYNKGHKGEVRHTK